MPDPILINRYASRRLYNTQTSEYVTLEEISVLIRNGNDVEIRDRKSGEDLTRQFLLQIITEQESKGENVLPINVLTGLVRSYSTATQSMLPDFLSKSYEAFSQQQSAMMKEITKAIPDGMPSQNPFEVGANWQKQQADMMKTMMAAWMPQVHSTDAPPATDSAPSEANDGNQELASVKAQLAELMKKVDGL